MRLFVKTTFMIEHDRRSRNQTAFQPGLKIFGTVVHLVNKIGWTLFGVRQLVGALVFFQSGDKSPHSKEASDFIPCAALTTDCSESESERLSDSVELQTPMV